MYSDHALFLYVLALEDGGERHKGGDPSLSVEQHDRNGAVHVKSVLLGSRHHTSAVVPSLHGRCDPDVFIGIFHAVNGHGGSFGLEVEKQTFYSDGGIVDRLIGSKAHFITYLTAVTVYTEAHVVEKAVFFAVNGGNGQPTKILLNGKRRVRALFSNILKEIVTGTHSIVEHVAFDLYTHGIVGKTVQGTVAAAEHNTVIFRFIGKKRCVLQLGYIQHGKLSFAVRSSRRFFDLLHPSVTLASSCKRIIQYKIRHCPSPCPSFQFVTTVFVLFFPSLVYPPIIN